MTNSVLRQAIFISLLSHITVFSMFSLSFGPKVTEVNFARVCFWGAILRGPDLMSNRNFDAGHKIGTVIRKSEILVLDKINRENLLASRDYIKPPISLTFNQEKQVFIQKPMPISIMPARKEPAIMFYPRLPYYFSLYFKDRQIVHIELSFKVISGNKRNSILVKRKISSGNLEADLLSMRYISRYLFMQQSEFIPNKWQTVKIDLSTKED